MVKKENHVLTITVAKDTLADMDAYCQKMNIKRSALVNLALSQYMQANKVIDIIYETVKEGVKSVKEE